MQQVPFLKKLALVAAVVSGNTFLAMFVISFAFDIETIWNTNDHRYYIAALTIVFTLAWHLVSRARLTANRSTYDHEVWYIGEVLVRYGLASVLLLYAFAKFTDGQFAQDFSDSETTIGEASGLKLAWAFFGYSKVYSGFIGGTQVICACLLFFRRTVLLASIILLPVLANITIMDFTHHISAEDVAISLLYMTLFLFMGYFKRLKAFFWLHEAIPALVHEVPVVIPRRTRLYAKALLITICLGYTYFENYSYQQKYTVRIPFTGSWVAEEEYRGQSMLQARYAIDTVRSKLFIEKYAYGTLIQGKERGLYYLNADESRQTVELQFYNDKDSSRLIKAKYRMIGKDRLELVGMQGKDSVRWLFRRMNAPI